ncbi:unnamed protein product [Cuscuta campestris]|uniref:Peptidase A1 domain-containing protein n=1 Tax=Cuscuta campestris TaxID=132261 RepID=A0A484NC05_9ASTE|nr:unnamed protein product [Cuscuta campestris]
MGWKAIIGGPSTIFLNSEAVHPQSLSINGEAVHPQSVRSEYFAFLLLKASSILRRCSSGWLCHNAIPADAEEIGVEWTSWIDFDPLTSDFLPKFGVCGRRRDMEDAVAVHPWFCRENRNELHYFAVYDGHGCSHVSEAQEKRRKNRGMQQVSPGAGVVQFPVQGTCDPYSAGKIFLGRREYYTRVLLGSSRVEFHVLIDRGSELSWINCASHSGCPSLSELLLELFNPASSSTSSVIQCSDPHCPSNHTAYSAQNTTCNYNILYADRSGISGYYIADNIHLDIIIENSTTSSTTSIVFGQNYHVHLEGININGQPLQIDRDIFANQRTVLDSGTYFVYLAQEVFSPLVHVIDQSASTYASLIPISDKRCYHVLSSPYDVFPLITLNLKGGASMVMRPRRDTTNVS